jgi:hypothetical protein
MSQENVEFLRNFLAGIGERQPGQEAQAQPDDVRSRLADRANWHYRGRAGRVLPR